MQEECGDGGSLDTGVVTTTPVVSPSGAASPRVATAGDDATSYLQSPPPKEETPTSSSVVGINSDSAGASQVLETVTEVQAIVGNVADLNLVQSVASLWSQDDPSQLLSSIPAINGSVGFGGSVGPHLFGGSGLNRLSTQRSLPQGQGQQGQRGVLTGPSGVGPVSGAGGFLGTKVSSSWSSGLGQASAWSTGAQGGLVGPSGGQGSASGNPVGAVAWGRGRGTNISHNLSNMRSLASGQQCPSVNLGKVSPASLATNMKFRRSTSFPGKSGLPPQHGPFPHQHSQMQPSHMQSSHMTPSFEITATEDPRDYLQFAVSCLISFVQ